MSKSTESKWRRERNRALLAIDMKWARQMMPDATSDHVLLVAMHKARYECPDLDNAARHASGEWLRQHGYRRLGGHPLLPEGELP